MDGKLVASYTQKMSMDVAATTATNAFTVFKNNPDSSKLSAVHFLKLKLTDAKGELLSNNFYWVGNTYLDYTALSKMPPVTESLKVSPAKISAAANGTNRVITYVVTMIPEQPPLLPYAPSYSMPKGNKYCRLFSTAVTFP